MSCLLRCFLLFFYLFTLITYNEVCTYFKCCNNEKGDLQLRADYTMLLFAVWGTLGWIPIRKKPFRNTRFKAIAINMFILVHIYTRTSFLIGRIATRNECLKYNKYFDLVFYCSHQQPYLSFQGLLKLHLVDYFCWFFLHSSKFLYLNNWLVHTTRSDLPNSYSR